MDLVLVALFSSKIVTFHRTLKTLRRIAEQDTMWNRFHDLKSKPCPEDIQVSYTIQFSVISHLDVSY